MWAPVAALLLGCVVCPAPLQIPTTAAQAPTQSVWKGVYTDQQAARGERAYLAECATCHPAMDGTGNTTGPALSGSDFIERWAGLSVGDIFITMRSTMPPNAPASLARETYVDILAYVLKSNRYPAGSSELTPEVAKLNPIVVEAKQP